MRPWLGLLIVGLGTLLAPLDTAVNIAFPSITRAFQLPLEDIRWVVIAYVLTYASLMLACGRLGDLVGYRPIFQIGLLLTGLGLSTCAVAPTYPLLLGGRALQGIGIALTLSCGPALATSLLGETMRTRALAFYAGVIAIGGALGPIVGGLLVASWDWPAVFFFRVPIAVLALALSPLIAVPAQARSLRGFDATGALLLTLWLGAPLIALAALPGSRDATLPLALIGLSLAAFVAVRWHERRVAEPVIRLALFRDPSFALLNAVNVIANFAAFGVLLLVPYYLALIRGLSPAAGGAVLAVSALGTVAGSWLADRLNRRLALGMLALAGFALNLAGLAAISTWTETSSLAVIAGALAVQGAGIGLFQVGYSDYVTGSLPLKDRGVAGSLTMLTRTVGVVLGATGLSAAFTLLEGTARRGLLPAEAAFVAGFQGTFRTVALALAVVLALSLLHPRLWRLRA